MPKVSVQTLYWLPAMILLLILTGLMIYPEKTGQFAFFTFIVALGLVAQAQKGLWPK